jgi:hypothetical protein
MRSPFTIAPPAIAGSLVSSSFINGRIELGGRQGRSVPGTDVSSCKKTEYGRGQASITVDAWAVNFAKPDSQHKVGDARRWQRARG